MSLLLPYFFIICEKIRKFALTILELNLFFLEIVDYLYFINIGMLVEIQNFESQGIRLNNYVSAAAPPSSVIKFESKISQIASCK